MGAGSIASDPNYHLVVTSDEALASLLSQDLSDEARVLLCVLRTPGVAIAQVAEETYLSPRAVRAAMAEANDRLQGIASLEARVGYGIDARFTGMEAPDLLAALAMDSSGVLAELERSCSVDSLMRMVGEKSDEYRLLMEPYLSQRQLRIQTLAAAYCCAWIVPDSTGVADARVRAVSLFQERKQRLLYRLITHRAAILARINEALSSHGIRPTREDLGSLIFDHVLRCALFPTIMSAEIQRQMRSMRMEHPFEFDFGSDLSESFREFDEHLYVERDFLSLYVLASLEHYSQRPVRVLLVCSRPSVATINKTLIERGVDGVEIELADDEAQAKRLLEQGTHDLVIGDSTVASRFSAEHGWDLSFSGVLSAAEVDRIRQFALRVLYERDIESLLPKDSYLELHVGGDRLPLRALLRAQGPGGEGRVVRGGDGPDPRQGEPGRAAAARRGCLPALHHPRHVGHLPAPRHPSGRAAARWGRVHRPHRHHACQPAACGQEQHVQLPLLRHARCRALTRAASAQLRGGRLVPET